MLKIKFINHACIQIFYDDFSLLIDPWFSGKVFNDSWCLLKDSDLADIDFESLRFIVISHEHPDHLNFETLKKIYNLKNDITCIFPNRADKTVKKVIEKIGFKFMFLKQNTEKFFLNDKDYIKFFSNKPEGDHTIALSIKEKVIINQNDDYTDDDIIKKINKEFKFVDILFTQFSLAGYYGNSNNHNLIKKNGHDFHLNRIVDYQKKFNAKIVVPFASFVYFCKVTNKYLNKFAVKPDEVLKSLGNKVCQLVFLNDEVYFDDRFMTRNSINLKKLENLFNLNNLKFYESKTIDEKEIINVINSKLFDMSLIKKINTLTNKFSLKKILHGLFKFIILLKPIRIKLTDSNKIIEINFLTNYTKLSKNKYGKIDFEIPSEELLYMFKFPWGSDTANITATVNYYSKRSFYFFEYHLKYYHIYGAKFF